MNWYDWPAIAFLSAFLFILQPKRRISHYVWALILASLVGFVVAMLVLMVWGITR